MQEPSARSLASIRAVAIRLASPEMILAWSSGEVREAAFYDPASGEPARGRLAQAAAGTGDEGDLLRQLVLRHVQTPCVCTCTGGCRVTTGQPPVRPSRRSKDRVKRSVSRSS